MYKNIDKTLSYRVFSGGPLVCIFTKSSKEVPDGMTAAWSCPFDPDVLLLVLDKEHTTSENIRHTKKFVVALPCEEQKKTALDVMSGALAYFECELQDEKLFEEKGICLSKVVNVYVKDDCWDDKEECFNPGIKRTLHHVAGSTFCSGGELV